LSWGFERGELPPAPTLDLLLEVFLAPIYFRVLFPHAPVTTDFLEHLIDILLDGRPPLRVPAGLLRIPRHRAPTVLAAGGSLPFEIWSLSTGSRARNPSVSVG
jgi:hypothetical protein